MTEVAYFQNPDTPDRLYRIESVDKTANKVHVCDAAGAKSVLNLNLLKLLHWRIIKKEE
jgi:hypothetical protein